MPEEGRVNNPPPGAGRPRERGVTLMELLIVSAIAAAMVSMALPAFTNGLEDYRLSEAASDTASFLNSALNRVERREQPLELSISIRENIIGVRSRDGAFAKKLDLPEGVRVEAALPALPEGLEAARRFLLLPGGTAPRVGIQLVNRRNQRRIVTLDPITGVPNITRPANP